MRAFLVAAMLVALTHDTSAQPNTDLMAVPNAERSAESEALMNLEDFAKRLEEAGFKEVEVGPTGVLIQAKDKFGKPVIMLFNFDTLVAVQLQPKPESETTGSGSSDETRSLWEKPR